MAEETMKDFENEINESFKNKKQIEDADAGKWEKFQQMMDEKTPIEVKIAEAVKAGCVAYVDDVRGFIPASHLSTQHVDDLEEYKGKKLEVVIITVEPEKKRLVMSHRALARAAQASAKAEKQAAIKVGDVLDGKVETLKDYGAFIDLGDGISGLLHVSQISYKRVKSPAAVLKEGQEVKVAVIGNKNGKISLSMKALEEAPAGYEEREERKPRRNKEEGEATFQYKEEGKVVTSMGDLLKNIKLN